MSDSEISTYQSFASDELSQDQKEHYLKLLKEKNLRLSQNKISQYYPETGLLSRHNYPKHIAVFEAGQKYSERCIMAANRIGKSEGIGAYEVTLHATGRYPDWWQGHKFTRPIKVWACGTTSTTARDIVQFKLIGSPEEHGTGMIPSKHILKTTPRAGGVPNAVDTILVQHISGGISRIKIKSYAEGRKSFEGTEQDFIWLDEECPEDVYTECYMRTMTTGGRILLTFTPLAGITKTVKSFLPNGQIKEGEVNKNKYLFMATWDDAPHITLEKKQEYYSALPPHQKEARSKGIPALGAGSIYPLLEENVITDDFLIPNSWKHCYALDVGWKKTACLWAATDPKTNITYLYSEYYQGQAQPFVHAVAVKARGKWIPGVIDSAAHGRSQEDGKQLYKSYTSCGLDLANANKAIETGLYNTWQMLSLGELKVFKSLRNWLGEFRTYHRDENGKIVKEDDHLMDCMRYLIMSGLDRAIAKPYWEFDAWEESDIHNEQEINLHTGY